MHLVNKKILLGVTGGIAAYKSADLVRRLREAGAIVRVVMTAGAKAFVTPLTFQAVSGLPVHEDLLDPHAEAAMGHIELAKWADIVLIAPASANFIGRLAHGLADDLLSTLCLATAAPIIIAPAMNQQMWHALATQENIQTLLTRGVALLGPATGEQACGDVGLGRMLEPTDIVTSLAQIAEQTNRLHNLKLIITAGPTQEAIDPVRYITNHSSGKMGYALARAAAQAGAQVTLISGPVNQLPPHNVRLVSVTTAEEMLAAVMQELPHCDIFIAAAAVVDYRVEQPATQKLKKSSEILSLNLTKTPDILATVSALPNKPFCVGFAAETEDLRKHALTKLRNKKLDMIAANLVGGPRQGFHADKNALTVLWNGGEQDIPLADKNSVAQQLLEIILQRKGLSHETKN